MQDNNGFQDMADYTSRLARVDPVKITKESLQEAAEYFVARLLPAIPRSLRNKKHMKDHVKIEVDEDKVTVYFEGTSYYWRFVENGTSKIRASHFVEGTWQQQKENIEDIMTQKLIKELEG
ncbi:MAG: HK97-gp10 family putative phage morphogenesis protein [Lactococcus garvieae]